MSWVYDSLYVLVVYVGTCSLVGQQLGFVSHCIIVILHVISSIQSGLVSRHIQVLLGILAQTAVDLNTVATKATQNPPIDVRSVSVTPSSRVRNPYRDGTPS